MMDRSRSNSASDRSYCLEFSHVWYLYESEAAVEDITFAVRQGEFVAILGPNGSGKTTLLKLALGLLKPAAPPAGNR